MTICLSSFWLKYHMMSWMIVSCRSQNKWATTMTSVMLEKHVRLFLRLVQSTLFKQKKEFPEKFKHFAKQDHKLSATNDNFSPWKLYCFLKRQTAILLSWLNFVQWILQLFSWRWVLRVVFSKPELIWILKRP